VAKSHRNNARAGEKIASVAYRNKELRRSKKDYVGPWTVTFKCAKIVFISMAGSSEVRDVAMDLHSMSNCKLPGCHPTTFKQEK